ncbi:hypothetical protein BDK61_2674 [Haloarcula quadrata]|uniref:Uncharacterized protein n=1 Tax=Haloarcula quadrata TaxID=182779 RepID=A0A495R7P9_9EURY|nr:hypothetical protein [Haloarcula quadrata]RKS83331.1 hypothetical protein BDK61_2674 [Haloarcula quadrata]
MLNEQPARERLEASLKTPYPADGEIWSALITAFANEYDELEQVFADILAAKFVTSATGEQLDRLATIFDLERRTDEPDSVFRIRAQTALRSQLSSGTIDEIRETIAVLLDAEIDDVVVDEPTDIEPARVDIGVWEEQLNDRNLTTDEFFQEAEPLTAAGVDVQGYARGTFEYAAAGDDPTDADRGYGTLTDDSVGGTYGSLLK